MSRLAKRYDDGKYMPAWYFTRACHTLRYGDDRLCTKGTMHMVATDQKALRVCVHGLHASRKLYDAISYAPGPILWRVKLHGLVIRGATLTKHCAECRTYMSHGYDFRDIAFPVLIKEFRRVLKQHGTRKHLTKKMRAMLRKKSRDLTPAERSLAVQAPYGKSVFNYKAKYDTRCLFSSFFEANTVSDLRALFHSLASHGIEPNYKMTEKDYHRLEKVAEARMKRLYHRLNVAVRLTMKSKKVKPHQPTYELA